MDTYTSNEPGPYEGLRLIRNRNVAGLLTMTETNSKSSSAFRDISANTSAALMHATSMYSRTLPPFSP